MPMKKGEVWFAEFPFEDKNETKKRPVVVLEDAQGELTVLCVKVTSRNARDEYDVDLLYWQNANLRFSSVVRTSKYLVLNKKSLIYKIGDLHSDDYSLVETKFMEYVLNKMN